jgi:hypothetical protein
MSNAFRHGSAHSVIAASKADWDDKSKKDLHFMLTFWDDGVPMYGTLRQGLTSGGITAPAFSISETLHYDVGFTDASGNQRRFQKASRDLPTVNSPDEEFLLGTLYPGVTSDPGGKFHVPHPDVEHSEPLAALAGMGLQIS